MIYLIGSLRNPELPGIARELRAAGLDIWDDWFAAGKFADDAWRDYEQARGRTYREALSGDAANHVFDFDYEHLMQADAGILITPAGKSGFMELGFIARVKPAYILLDDPERWDVMLKLVEKNGGLVTTDLNEIIEELRKKA